jgi:hypothetical protein
MARYRVAFDGKWQGTFDELDDALDWAREVGETGRIAYVIQRRWWWWPKLVAAFPEHERETARLYWKKRGGGGHEGHGSWG